mmetsp:Transcript_23523/g.58267  ORF Transcript_23523/g.58267 Transcript_23523/m.58267 type:complete len:254 (+) Transcript_23523:580-1341(+)
MDLLCQLPHQSQPSLDAPPHLDGAHAAGPQRAPDALHLHLGARKEHMRTGAEPSVRPLVLGEARRQHVPLVMPHRRGVVHQPDVIAIDAQRERLGQDRRVIVAQGADRLTGLRVKVVVFRGGRVGAGRSFVVVASVGTRAPGAAAAAAGGFGDDDSVGRHVHIRFDQVGRSADAVSARFLCFRMLHVNEARAQGHPPTAGYQRHLPEKVHECLLVEFAASRGVVIFIVVKGGGEAKPQRRGRGRRGGGVDRVR